MKHAWRDAPRIDNHPMGLACRECEACGVYQEKITDAYWGRIEGYSWKPEVGKKCPGERPTLYCCFINYSWLGDTVKQFTTKDRIKALRWEHKNSYYGKMILTKEEYEARLRQTPARPDEDPV